MNVIPQAHQGILGTTAMAHVATIGPHGEPQSNPVWFDWDGKNIRFSQTKTRQKYHNLKRDPRIALSIIDPQDPYHYLEIRGRVVNIEDDANNRFIDAMAKKYLGKDQYPFHQPGDERVIITVKPEHTTSQG